ncbi:MAG TPA: Wzz/FepE/Etk N-terminal domain-containing protein [Rhizomicrobium sp.]|jgi:hypothetical protein|nr:Wzz/FepE/Etk N-terminal domain-containing protein [Rhizomicrobium sp.]
MTDGRQNDPYVGLDEPGGLSIAHFVQAVADRSRIVWAVVALCIIVGCALIILPPPQYTISYIAYPSQSSQDKSLGSTLSALAGPLAGLIGSGATSDVQPFDLYMELIVSPHLAQRVINKDPEVLHKIFYKEWDPVSKTYHPPHDVLSTISRIFAYIFGLPAYAPPTAARLSSWLTDNLTIAAVNSTSMQQISFTTPYPSFGVRFLTEMNTEADAIIREEAAKLTDAQISYLENKLSQIQVSDYRQTILSLLSAQETTRMSINEYLPYASVVLQNSFSSDLPTSPNPLIILIIALVAGLVLGTFAALTAAMVWPNGARRFVPSRYRVVTAYRRAVWYLTLPKKTGAQPAE